LVAKGFFKILTAGDYTFKLFRNSRGSLKIDSTVQLIYDGSTRTVVVTLTEGDHEIESVYSEISGTKEWKINYKGPDTYNIYEPLRSDNNKIVPGNYEFCLEVWAGTKKKEVSGLNLVISECPAVITSTVLTVTTQTVTFDAADPRFKISEHT